jgi:outer membrane protein assembly factor BamB
MKFKLSSSLLLVTLIAGFVTAQAQIPCGPTISPLPTLFVNWPQYHFDPNHSGCSPYESLLSINTVRNLVLKLKFVTSGEIFASPVVANGIAYTASGSGDLYAVSVNTGEFLWGLWAFASIQASPVVSNGVVYVGSFDGYPDNLFALNARTGDVLWQYETTTGQIQGDGALAVSNGVLYVGTNLGLEALDATTGALLWKETSLGGARPTVSNGMVYIAAGIRQGIVYALDAGTGKVIWSSSTGYYPFACTPVVVNNMVYVGTSENHVVAMDAKTGATLWTSTLGGLTRRGSGGGGWRTLRYFEGTI